MEKKGRRLEVGLTSDQILAAARKEEAKSMEDLLDMSEDMSEDNFQPVLGNIEQGGSLAPFTGPLEDLFTCSASPSPTGEPSQFISEPSPFVSLPSSPEESLFDVSSPTSSLADYNEPDFLGWAWSYMDQFPNLMKLVGIAKQAEQDNAMDEEMCRWSESIMV